MEEKAGLIKEDIEYLRYRLRSSPYHQLSLDFSGNPINVPLIYDNQKIEEKKDAAPQT